jgi:ferrous iron transport protein A
MMALPDRPSLADLPVGSSGLVGSVELVGMLRRRVLDLGIIPGTVVACVRKSPAGDPTAYAVRGSTIALRSVDAARIKLSPGLSTRGE